MVLVVIEVAGSHSTAEALRMLFATHGIPETLVSDNGPCFASAEVAAFLKENGIEHVRAAPYHPTSNGLVE